VVLIVLLGLWFWRVDPLAGVITDQRWIAWKHAAWSMRSEILGRGLGSFKTVFPLLASGDARIGEVKNEAGKITMNNAFLEAHNEYVQAAFELGLQMAFLMVLFAGFVTWAILTRQVPAHAAAGVAALMVACMGWHVFHIAPLALLGCAWLGQWERRSENIS
jgi:O-antigen ligase